MSQESRFVRWAFRITDLIIVNVLFVICCIPVITVGASVTAMYSITIKMVRDEEPASMVKGFFRAFRDDFVQSTVIWVILALFGAALYLDWRIAVSLSQGPARSVLTGILIAAVCVWMCIFSYVFALTARFKNATMEMIRNSFHLSLGNLKFTVPAVILNLTPLLMIFVPAGWLRWIFLAFFFIWFSAVSYLNSMMLRPLFDRIAGDGKD